MQYLHIHVCVKSYFNIVEIHNNYFHAIQLSWAEACSKCAPNMPPPPTPDAADNTVQAKTCLESLDHRIYSVNTSMYFSN